LKPRSTRAALAARVGAACAPIALTLAIVTPAQAAALSTEERKFLTYYTEADRLAGVAQDKAWPGFKFEKYPLVVFEPDRVAFQFGSRTPLPGFMALSGAPGGARFPIFVKWGATRSIIGGTSMSDFVLSVGGRKVIPIATSGIRAALPNGFSPASFYHFPLMVHLKESYPWFGEYMAKGEDWIAQYPLSDTENFALADLENACIKRAATATSPEEAQKAARWFVAVRQSRQAKLSGTSVRHENYQEALVGTARYGAMALSARGSSPDYKPLDAFKALAQGWAYPTQSDLARWLSSSFDVPMDARALSRERLSLTGIGQALLLDRFKAKDWRKELPGTSNLTPLLARAVDFADADRADLLAEAKANLSYEVMAIRARGIVENNMRMAEAFDRQPGWTVKVRLPDVASRPNLRRTLGLRWEPVGYRPLELDPRTQLFLPPYKVIEYTNPDIAIKLDGVPAKFYSTEYAHPFRNLILRLPLDARSVNLDGRPLELRPARRTIARNLTIKAGKAKLTFNKGRVAVNRDSLEITP
jgi:hypothetical protein